MARPPHLDHKAMAPPPLPETFSLAPPSQEIQSPSALPSSPPPLAGQPFANRTEAMRPGSTIRRNAPAVPGLHLQTDDPIDEEDRPLFDGFTIFTALPSWLISTMVHLTLLLFTALLFFPISDSPGTLDLVLEEASTPEEELGEIDSFELATHDDMLDASEPELEVAEQDVVIEPILDFAEAMTNQANEIDTLIPELKDLGLQVASARQSGSPKTIGGGLGLRNPQSRLQQVLDAGGTRGSEAAVERALQWLASQQRKDGGWDLAAGEPGFVETRGRNGATGLALLPFLGAGHTHKTGKYRQVVERGIYFLSDRMDVDGIGKTANGSLTDSLGSYYSHGLGTIALCEAYAMTRDQSLRMPAQQLINEIVDAQDPSGGGWRYRRREPGDTSVLGWQLMALKSGKMAYLDVPDATFLRASRFLDSVQTNYGAAYGYTSPNTRPSTSAVGLLSRMYLGWDHDRPALKRGVNVISDKGPDKDEIYFCYYATQVLHHYGGPKWKKWNAKMRDSLVTSQSRGGANDGSWQLRTSHNRSRLYCTSMATMILEVYYRHMPLYGAQAADGIPL